MTIYVSNLSFTVSEEQLNSAFTPFGLVDSVKIITDKFTSRSRGFGFVEMKDDNEAQKAIDALHGQVMEGRAMTVNKAKPKTAF